MRIFQPVVVRRKKLFMIPFSYFEYYLIFVPLTVGIYWFLASIRKDRRTIAAKAAILIASLLFYAWLNPVYLPLLLVSIFANFAVFRFFRSQYAQRPSLKKTILAFGICLNVALLAYFKYMDFFIGTVNTIADARLPLLKIAFPIGISFYTFVQIAFLVDAYRSTIHQNPFLDYAIFVSFFPKVVSGPIVYHHELVPQLSDEKSRRPSYEAIARGLFLVSVGLFKKVVIADNLALWATQGFDHAAKLTLFEAWFASLSFILQVYFDFSGYTDMALGTALFFNIRLPINFDAPYKSKSIQELWRRWHITLMRFLRDYIYIPLGGSRLGELRTCVNIVIIFIIGGFWHGPAWTFIVWGLCNGIAMIVYRYWRKAKLRLPAFLGWLITFNFFHISGVFFRATSFESVWKIYRGLFGLEGVMLPQGWSKLSFLAKAGIQFGPWLANLGDRHSYLIWFIAAGLIISTLGKNSMELAERLRPNLRWAIFTAFLLGVSIIHMTKVTEFIYANF